MFITFWKINSTPPAPYSDSSAFSPVNPRFSMLRHSPSPPLTRPLPTPHHLAASSCEGLCCHPFILVPPEFQLGQMENITHRVVVSSPFDTMRHNNPEVQRVHLVTEVILIPWKDYLYSLRLVWTSWIPYSLDKCMPLTTLR
jgi:hypothetical protein